MQNPLSVSHCCPGEVVAQIQVMRLPSWFCYGATAFLAFAAVKCSAFLTSGSPLPTLFLKQHQSQTSRPLRLGAGLKSTLQEGEAPPPDFLYSVPRKVWKIDVPGNLKQLELVQDMLPPPAAGEITVRVHSVGMNFADVFTVLGMYDAAPKGQSVIPGLEFAGVVEAVGDRKGKPQAKVQRSDDGKSYVVVDRDGEEVEGSERSVRVGDRVMGFTRFGAYATHINIQAAFVRKIPDEWSFQQGAAFLVQALTAWYGAVELGKAEEGKAVLVHAAAGGVGQFTLNIAEIFGMKPVAIVGSEEKATLVQRLYSLPEHQTIIRPHRASEFRRLLHASLDAIGRPGFDIIMDSVAGKYFQPGYDSLHLGGRHIMFGAAVYTPKGDLGKVWTSFEFWRRIVPTFLSRPKLDVQKMIGENKAVMGFNLIWLWDGESEPAGLIKLIDDMMQPSVRWRPPLVGREFDFSEALEALRYFKSGASVGKVVLNVADET